jgi:hypothetical protein
MLPFASGLEIRLPEPPSKPKNSSCDKRKYHVFSKFAILIPVYMIE